MGQYGFPDSKGSARADARDPRGKGRFLALSVVRCIAATTVAIGCTADKLRQLALPASAAFDP